MRKNHCCSSAALLLAVTALGGCESPSPRIQAQLRLSLAQTSGASITYAEVAATQGGTTATAVLDANGEATLRVAAGFRAACRPRSSI